MKKRLLLLTVLVIALVCLLAIGASAEVTTYDDAPAREKITVSTSDVVVFDDGFTCPSAYIFKDSDSISAGDHTGKNGLQSSVDFSYINGKTNETYDVSRIVELDIPEGIKTLGAYAFTRLGIKRVSIPKTATTIGNCCFEKCKSLEECVFEHTSESGLESLPAWIFQECIALKAFCFPECITKISSEYEFSGCTSLTAVYLPKGLTAYNTPGNDQKSVFWNCQKMYFVNEPFTYDNIPEKPAIYYMPSGLTSVSGEMFKKCINLNETIVFPVGVTQLTNSYAFTTGSSSTVKNVVFLGDMTALNTSNWNLANGAKIIFANANDTGSSSLSSLSGGHTKIYCASEADLSKHVAEKTSITEATCVNDEAVVEVCFCGRTIKSETIDNTATGIHIWKTNDCTESVKCDTCTEMSPANAEHKIVKTLVYANGFDKAGEYNCICKNADYCTAIEGYIVDEPTNPIITFKGYSVPELASYFGINAGYKIDTDLLTLYESLSDEKVTVGLLMVNADDVGNVADLIDADAKLVANVRGFSVTMTTLNYEDISIEIKGFDKSTAEGNYYKLALVSAIFVKTGDDIEYLQDAIGDETVATQVQTTSGTAFDTITADRVYLSKQ